MNITMPQEYDIVQPHNQTAVLNYILEMWYYINNTISVSKYNYNYI